MPLTDSPTLARDLRAIFRALRRRFREAAPLGEFTPSQNAVLDRLEQHGASTASSLARAEGMRPQSMGPIIAALESCGMILGEADPADRRQTLWSLSESYRAQIRARREARQDWLARTIAARLNPEEQQELLRATSLLWRVVQP